MAFLTLFTAPKAFTQAHINAIQRNALQSWRHLGSDVEVLLIGQEDGLPEVATELGLRHLPDVARNVQGTPLVSSIFEIARQSSTSPLLAYVNADILLMPDFVEAAHQVAEQAEKFLIVGQRWDLMVEDLLDFPDDWVKRLRERTFQNGKLHPRYGSDYFIFPRACFADMPAFAIGRAGWDNWMIYKGRNEHWKVVDGTASIQIVHQNHDYAHLPGGQPHYRLPETDENIRLAGGKRTIFNLLDANLQLVDGKLRAPALTWQKIWRDIETFPLTSVHSYPLAQAAYACFHPIKAFRELRKRKE